MIRDHFVLFDAYVTTLDTDFYPSPEHLARLAAHDQLSLFAVGSKTGSWTATLTMALEHSSDGVNFDDKTLSGAPTALLGEGSPSTHAYDPGDEATLEYARLRLRLTTTPIYLKVFATLRDRS